MPARGAREAVSEAVSWSRGCRGVNGPVRLRRSCGWCSPPGSGGHGADRCSGLPCKHADCLRLAVEATGNRSVEFQFRGRKAEPWRTKRRSRASAPRRCHGRAQRTARTSAGPTRRDGRADGGGETAGGNRVRCAALLPAEPLAEGGDLVEARPPRRAASPGRRSKRHRTVHLLRARGPEAVARETLARVSAAPVHFDVDVLDPTLMAAVDSPLPDGLSTAEVEALLEPLVKHPAALRAS
jgi:Arginase family